MNIEHFFGLKQLLKILGKVKSSSSTINEHIFSKLPGKRYPMWSYRYWSF